jgi:hypothetical protein
MPPVNRALYPAGSCRHLCLLPGLAALKGRPPNHRLQPVAGYVARLRLAEKLDFAFPQWWFNVPAILKGFFDLVFVPGVARHLTLDSLIVLFDFRGWLCDPLSPRSWCGPFLSS